MAPINRLLGGNAALNSNAAADAVDGGAHEPPAAELLRKMSHELRTPLNAIIGYSDLSESAAFGALDEPYRAYFGNIRNAAEHLLHVVNDLLDMAAIEADRLRLSLAPIGLGQIIGEARDIVAARVADAGVDLAAVAVEDGWRVHADADRLRRICINLLDNAVKFTPSGARAGIDVTLSDPGELAIAFWDTGIGIDPSAQARIFDGVFALDGGSASGSASGAVTDPSDLAGLGLPIARRLARVMGGDLTVDSTPGQGACFTLALPQAAAGSAQAAE